MDGLYNHIAPFYDLIDLPFELIYYRNMRSRWLSGLRNHRILEIGVGTGKNLKYYHSSNKVTAIDQSRGMLSIASKRLKKLNSGHIELSFQAKLPWPLPRNFTVAVATFVLCTMKDPQPVLQEIWQHLVPGGKLIIFEFGRSKNPSLYTIEKAINPLTKTLFGVDFDRKPTVELLNGRWKILDINWVLGDMIYQAVLERE